MATNRNGIGPTTLKRACNSTANTHTKYLLNYILNVGMEKEQKQELGWRVSLLPIPAFFHCACEPLCVCMYTVYSGMQEWVIQIPSIPILVSVLFPSLHLE